jgi:hypothetical protein
MVDLVFIILVLGFWVYSIIDNIIFFSKLRKLEDKIKKVEDKYYGK